ncbi:MAG: hypothetical protein WCK82_08890 [Bacteroidota bacterium]
MKKVEILVPSCDKYSDVWPFLIESIKIYWPEMSFKINIICNGLKPLGLDDNINFIDVGEDKGWSANLILALKKIEADFIFLWIDDLILYESVNNDKFIKILRNFLEVNGSYLRFNPVPKYDFSYNEYFGETSKNAIYRTSTVMTIWRKDILFSLLREEESAWGFEYNSIFRAKELSHFFVVYKSIFAFKNVIVKGKWHPKELSWLKLSFPHIPIGNRIEMNAFETLKLNIKSVLAIRYYNLFNLKNRYF